MLIVVNLLFIAAIVIGAILVYKSNTKIEGGGLLCLGIVLIMAFACAEMFIASWTFTVINDVATENVIDEKIVMCQEENAKIEEKLNIVVKEYMDYEQETFETSKSESVIELISLYPTLKADKLVERQIDRYNKNTDSIKQLKTEKIELSKKKWLLYFGH